MWAFGVTLWELYSLGEIPYAGLSNSETTEKVLGGFRLAKPLLCPDKIYEIMLLCWKEVANERPTIIDICKLLTNE